MKRRNFLAWIFLSLFFICGVGIVRWLNANSDAEPVFRIVYEAKNNLVDDAFHVPIPNKGYLHASVAIDESGNFYILTRKRVMTSQIPGVPSSMAPERAADLRRLQQNVVHLLITNTNGHVKGVVPLRRLDGRPVRSYCEFLAVGASGKRWWTLRQARESLEDWKDRDEVEKRTVLLNAYDNQGKCLGEWKVPVDLAIETFAMAAIGSEAYIVPENLEQEKQLLIYSVGNSQLKKHSWPGTWIPTIGSSFITLHGQFWHLLPSDSGNIQAFFTNLNKPSILFTSFHWQPKGSLPFLFWADDRSGLFVFEYLKDNQDKIRFADGAKAVYHVTPDGTVQKLFETPDVLQQRFGYQVRTGQPLKADDHYIWLEAEYLKDGKVAEYQIVKVKYR